MKQVAISLLTVIGLGFLVVMPLKASTQSMQNGTRSQDQHLAMQHQGQYEVFSRRTKHSAWKSEGTYSSKAEALQKVRKLHSKGLLAVYESH